MKVLMISWEYPPHSVGGLARHVEDLAETLAAQNQEIYVLTVGVSGLPENEKRNGVWVHRVHPYSINTPDFSTWVLQLNLSLLEKSIKIMGEHGPFQIVHAHDWLVAYCGKVLKHSYHLPLVATIHATEAGRNQGLHNDQQRYISSVEWWLTYEAWKVIICSKHMFDEVRGLFQLPKDKLVVIPNGVRPEKFQAAFPDPEVQRIVKTDEEIIFFIGRLVREKGVQVLLQAMPAILYARPQVKLVIAGTGPMQNELRFLSEKLGIGHKVYFAGYVDDRAKKYFYSKAKAAIFPSLYEPFGIVALEGMAAGVPVVVSDTGGLAEIVTHHVNGFKAYPGDVHSLATNVIEALNNEKLRERVKNSARELIENNYSWPKIARDTLVVYRQVQKEHYNSSWATGHRPLGKALSYCLSLINSKSPENDLSYPATRNHSLIEQRVSAVNWHHEGRGRI